MAAVYHCFISNVKMERNISFADKMLWPPFISTLNIYIVKYDDNLKYDDKFLKYDDKFYQSFLLGSYIKTEICKKI